MLAVVTTALLAAVVPLPAQESVPWQVEEKHDRWSIAVDLSTARAVILG